MNSPSFAASFLLPLLVFQPLHLFSFVLLPFEYSCSVGVPLFFLAHTNTRPRPEYLAWCLVCHLWYGRGSEAGVAHSRMTVNRASHSSAPTVRMSGIFLNTLVYFHIFMLEQ